MANKKKNLAKSVVQEGTRRVKSEAVRRKELAKSTVRTRLESFIPASLRWILPFADELHTDSQPLTPEATEATVDIPAAASETGVRQQDHRLRYEQYRCWHGNPLGCHFPQQTVQQDPDARYCLECGFPAALAEKAEIRGHRGRYRINHWLGHRGLGRLYQGVQVPDDQPVVIKEYLLPSRCFSPQEMQQQQQIFIQLAGLRSLDGSIQDFRLSSPWDAIADHHQERCYLVTKGNLETQPTLQQFLAENGAMSEPQVRQVLNQVLQTLEFLHRQKLQLPNGQVVNDFPQAYTAEIPLRSLAHGNLSLDSLLITGSPDFWLHRRQTPGNTTTPQTEEDAKPESLLDALLRPLANDSPTYSPAHPQQQEPHRANSQPQASTDFFIYLCDLALWESLFNPPPARSAEPSAAQDLVALGYIAFYLLIGRSPDWLHRLSEQERMAPFPEIQDPQQWPTVDPKLQTFILRLAGIEKPFESAEVARQALLQLPREKPESTAISRIEAEAIEPTRAVRPAWILLGIATFALLAGLSWWLFSRNRVTPGVADGLPACCIQQVPAVPEGSFKYSAEQSGTWNYVLQQENLILPGRNLAEELRDRKPKLRLSFQPVEYQPASPSAAVIEAVQSGKVDFGITSQAQALTSDLAAQPIAYDGLVVFVAFSYAQRELGLPKALKGQISFAQLRQLYTGEITRWRELNPQLPDLPVKLYIPTETEAVRIFEQRVLQDEALIAKFRSLLPPETGSFIRQPGNQIRPLSTFDSLKAVIDDFENSQAGAIAFGTVSQVFGQCSVYPLALDSGNQQPIQALVQDNGQPITPATDLCDDKGSYQPHLPVFKSGHYPLAYPLSVIYPRDNSRPPAGQKFAEIMRTQEGQRLLQKTGLVPLIDLKSSTFSY